MPFKRRVAPPSEAGPRTLPASAVELATVVAHLGRCSRHTILFLDFQLMSAGATNSGKTYNALQFLLQRAQASVASEDGGSSAAGAFVYAGPLRMLAREVYDELCLHLSPEYVGLITAEEQINASARVLSCVTECAPLGGDTLVLDEVHWLAEKERGPAWTRLLAATSNVGSSDVKSGFKHLHICGAFEAQSLLTRAFPDITVHHASRRSTISIPDPLKVGVCISDLCQASSSTLLPRPCAIVAFSRASVLGLASFLREHPLLEDRVGVLCGCSSCISFSGLV
jgi:ATP-dependent RNA helicase SUPV3L1/SUV3